MRFTVRTVVSPTEAKRLGGWSDGVEAARRNVDRKGTILEITAQKGYTNTMVKTLLKSVLIVLVLAGVFFFALQLWLSW